MGTPHLGIDLGTTNSAAAVFDGERISIVRDSQGRTLTPSVVRIDARGNATVGARARRFLETDPQNTRGEFKRLMGTSHRLVFPAAKLEKRPEELAALVLGAIRQDVSDQLGFLPSSAVISVPALFELPQTAATSEAARLAGFTRVEMIQEPVASAIAAGWRSGDDGRPWLVYDLGGGTFDASLLETSEGLLRVVGHDGDNFLGGRDLDQAIVDWALSELAAQGVAIDPADPAHAVALRKLRYAAEEAKIELSRAREVDLSVPALFEVAGERVDVALTFDRATLERLADPLVHRSLQVCLRLLATHGLRPGDLGQIVLVGGPTVMARLRAQVSETLLAPLKTELDPMTLVAQGAALFSATAGLDARPAAPAKETARGPAVWLQHPSMTSDLTPYVVGRVLDRAAQIEAVRLRREGWESPPEPVDAEGAFALMLNLPPRAATIFQVEGLQQGRWLELSPPTLSMIHGVSLQDPPLSRSVGVALADDRVRVFFERGSPLPSRRSFAFQAVATVLPGTVGDALSVPIVQGEFSVAHLCRLVGTLEIPGKALQAPLAVGSPIEVTLEMDRGGVLRATAQLASGQTFASVAHLLVPSMPPAVLAEQLLALRTRVATARATVFGKLDGDGIIAIAEAERMLGDAERSVALAAGGDPDAAERARRNLLEIDGILAAQEIASAWPVLISEAQRTLERAVIWVGNRGTAVERDVLTDAATRLKRAIAAQAAEEVNEVRDLLRELIGACWLRQPGAWVAEFDHAASRVSDCSDLRQANALVARGREERARDDEASLERTVRSLWALMPIDPKKRLRSFGSGVR